MKPQEKPVLDPESFQRLLAAAFILQPPNTPRTVASSDADHLRSFPRAAFVQKRTPSRRRPWWHLSRLILHSKSAWPMIARIAETLAIAAVFGAMFGVSIRRVSPRSGDPSLPSVMAKPRTVQFNAFPATKDVAQSQTPVLRVDARRSIDRGEADVVAEDVVTRHLGHSGQIRDDPAAKRLTGSDLRARRSRANNKTLPAGVLFSFGTDTDARAADTVVRYGARPATPSLRVQAKPY